MARAKHKVEQMIKYNDNGTASHDVITGVIARKDGFFYEVEKSDDEVAEKDVISAFRPVVTRTRKSAPRAAKASAKKTVAKEERAAA